MVVTGGTQEHFLRARFLGFLFFVLFLINRYSPGLKCVL